MPPSPSSSSLPWWYDVAPEVGKKLLHRQASPFSANRCTSMQIDTDTFFAAEGSSLPAVIKKKQSCSLWAVEGWCIDKMLSLKLQKNWSEIRTGSSLFLIWLFWSCRVSDFSKFSNKRWYEVCLPSDIIQTPIVHKISSHKVRSAPQQKNKGKILSLSESEPDLELTLIRTFFLWK